MTTTLTASKVITPIVHRDNGRVEIEYQAEFDGQLIGFFPTYLTAEEALNDHALRLIEDGLVDLPLTLLAADPESPDPGPQPWEGPAFLSALRTFTPAPPPVHDGDLIQALADEASLAVAAINVMLHRAVRERERQRALLHSYDTPADRLADRLYRLHGKACERSIRRSRAHKAWMDEHTCPGLDCPCGASALNAYHGTTGFDMETARPITPYYCDKHFKELTELAKPVEQETVCDITFDHHGTPMTYRMREPYAGRFIARLRDQGYAPQAEPVA